MERRNFLKLATAGAAVASGAYVFMGRDSHAETPVFIGKAASYQADIPGLLKQALAGLRFDPARIAGKTVLLKPNLVEPHSGAGHINTHPAVVAAAAEAFLSLGAGRVVVAEAAGHRRDTHEVLELSGLGHALREDRIPFMDFNACELSAVTNASGLTSLKKLFLPNPLLAADLIVSVAKMKTHHWAGVTLSMKNLFGVMPGTVYGWPKNVLHAEGIPNSIVDIFATVKPHLAIVDGIVGMEGDGPIMGTPKHAGVIVVGENPVSVDATCARIMGADPWKVPYLKLARRYGPLSERAIIQRGEPVGEVYSPFKFLDFIDAQRIKTDG
ncbi:DUF362 domain-containing protein [Fundidesulfovibrio soli]|uniref:DUF362 domain-containing protein n=1 Tax=Fundidesulfovibrio soli TaxID=2922716 RepID=UPI001FAE9D05|nr:DUF362 domain-containing protein [Fundidesulfovibrio soli]